MHCIKTGFYARLPSGLYLYGDAFALGSDENAYAEDPRYATDHLLLRITSCSNERPPAVHITLETWENWFEEKACENVGDIGEYAVIWQPSSTLIAAPGQWTWNGYNGVTQ